MRILFVAAEGLNLEVQSRESRGLVWSEKAGTGACLTSKGELGHCTSFKECYPYFKIPDLGALDGWVLGVYDTCSYIREDGRMAFGVCCAGSNLPSLPPSATGGGPIIDDPLVNRRFYQYKAMLVKHTKY